MNVRRRWNSTNDMLNITFEYENAIERLARVDTNYDLNPTKEEWRMAYVMHDCLKKFSDATVPFSSSHPTANIFFSDVVR